MQSVLHSNWFKQSKSLDLNTDWELTVNVKQFFHFICSYLPTQQSTKPPSCTTAFTGGISVGNKAQAHSPSQSQAQNFPNWSHVQPSKPVHSGYVQPQYNQQSSQPYYQSEPAYAVNQNQNQNQYQPQVRSHLTFVRFCSSTVGISIKSREFSKCFFLSMGHTAIACHFTGKVFNTKTYKWRTQTKIDVQRKWAKMHEPLVKFAKISPLWHWKMIANNRCIGYCRAITMT